MANLLLEGDHTWLDLRERVVGDLLLRVGLQLPQVLRERLQQLPRHHERNFVRHHCNRIDTNN